MSAGHFYVDVPDSSDPAGSWVNVGEFDTREEAIAYAKETFSADDDGRIGLVSFLSDEMDQAVPA